MKAVIYDEASGRVLRSIEGPADHIALQCTQGESYVIGEGSDATHYVELPAVYLREKGDYTIEALPLPCTVTIEGVEYRCDSQPVFGFVDPGEYVVSVDAGPAYYKKEFTVHAD